MSSRSHRVVQLHTPMSEDERLSLVEQTALCHPAVHSVEVTPGDEISVEVVVWRGSSPQRTARDIAAALGAVLGEVSVHVTVVAVAYMRRSTVLMAMCPA
ncbi:hypothetical protein [Lentzea sp. NPDC055074]